MPSNSKEDKKDGSDPRSSSFNLMPNIFPASVSGSFYRLKRSKKQDIEEKDILESIPDRDLDGLQRFLQEEIEKRINKVPGTFPVATIIKKARLIAEDILTPKPKEELTLLSRILQQCIDYTDLGEEEREKLKKIIQEAASASREAAKGVIKFFLPGAPDLISGVATIVRLAPKLCDIMEGKLKEGLSEVHSFTTFDPDNQKKLLNCLILYKIHEELRLKTDNITISRDEVEISKDFIDGFLISFMKTIASTMQNKTDIEIKLFDIMANKMSDRLIPSTSKSAALQQPIPAEYIALNEELSSKITKRFRLTGKKTSATEKGSESEDDVQPIVLVRGLGRCEIQIPHGNSADLKFDPKQSVELDLEDAKFILECGCLTKVLCIKELNSEVMENIEDGEPIFYRDRDCNRILITKDNNGLKTVFCTKGLSSEVMENIEDGESIFYKDRDGNQILITKDQSIDRVTIDFEVDLNDGEKITTTDVKITNIPTKDIEKLLQKKGDIKKDIQDLLSLPRQLQHIRAGYPVEMEYITIEDMKAIEEDVEKMENISDNDKILLVKYGEQQYRPCLQTNGYFKILGSPKQPVSPYMLESELKNTNRPSSSMEIVDNGGRPLAKKSGRG